MLTESQRRAPGQAEQDSIRFREQVIRPDQRWIVSKLQILLDDMEVDDYELKLLEGDLTEITARARAAEALGRRGFLSADEARAWVNNWPPLPDGAGELPFVVIAGQRAVTNEVIQVLNKLIHEAAESGKLSVADVPQTFDYDPGKNGKGNTKDAVREVVERAGLDMDDADMVLLIDELGEIMEVVGPGETR
ncbi:hypothetical protein LCGC14_1560920 [marine sediment metagenome]|uniref:Uncharacterized protein n=1 Tax=marine sediment metagenome TaxID=412755 RepID=A0A0F9L3V2_9ZZZZ